jgi:hypothetical protein
MENISIEENKDCIICFNSYKTSYYIIFNCNHEICIYCYEKLLNNNKLKCPLCRIIIIDIDNGNTGNNIIQPNSVNNNNEISNIINNVINNNNADIESHSIIIKVSIILGFMLILLIIMIVIINYR